MSGTHVDESAGLSHTDIRTHVNPASIDTIETERQSTSSIRYLEEMKEIDNWLDPVVTV